MRGDCEKTNRMSEMEKKVGKVREMFSEKKNIEFMDFLRWKIEFMQASGQWKKIYQKMCILYILYIFYIFSYVIYIYFYYYIYYFSFSNIF